MLNSFNLFVDHTFLIAFLFGDSTDELTRENHEKARNYVDGFKTYKPTPKFITTNLELVSAISYILEKSKFNRKKAIEAKHSIISSPRFRVETLEEPELQGALKDFQNPDFRIRCEFLDITSFQFLKNKASRLGIKWVLAMQNDYYEAAPLYGFEVWK
jgi:predicted nucleic acid-binding protein